MQGDLVAVSVGVELPGSERYPFTRGTVLGSGGQRGWVHIAVLVRRELWHRQASNSPLHQLCC